VRDITGIYDIQIINDSIYETINNITMGIFGEFRVEMPRCTIRNMEIFHAGYIFCTNFILSKGLLYIPLDTEVFYKIEEVRQAHFDNYVAIYKMEAGLTADCFDIDLNEDPDFDIRPWYLEPVLIWNLTRKELIKKPDEALTIEYYPTAAKIRDEIKRKKE
jgi:hypothetical protein